ncbi:MAG TPA: helix-turn-helix transcriptional regulator [Polyangiaceae bacterium]
MVRRNAGRPCRRPEVRHVAFDVGRALRALRRHSPIQYLAQWRIQLAASLLCTSKASLAQIAERVGYGSEAALSRAFKRTVGIAPAPYRRGASAKRIE